MAGTSDVDRGHNATFKLVGLGVPSLGAYCEVPARLRLLRPLLLSWSSDAVPARLLAGVAKMQEFHFLLSGKTLF